VQIGSMVLLVAALGFLILGLVGSSSVLVIASIVTSAAAAYLIVRAHAANRATADRDAASGVTANRVTANRAAADHDAASGVTADRAAADRVTASGADATDPVLDDTVAVLNDAPEPAQAETQPPLQQHGRDPVWVIDGHPRYHLASCAFLNGRDCEPIPLRQACEDGFSPCVLCNPDQALAAALPIDE
jgi:hypothetical protein